MLPPVGTQSENERGLAAVISHEGTEMLITGDMDADMEKKLLSLYDLPDVEILIAGHHGSKNATSEHLLDAVTPETVVISVGRNSYGHPADETLQRIYSSGAVIFRTDEAGNITIRID